MSEDERFVSPYDLIGGRATVERLAHAIYDAMEELEPELTALHDLKAPGRVTDDVRSWFASFLVMWTGGPDDYMNERGHPRLRWRHNRVPIDTAMRDAWLRAMSVAMDRCDVRGPARDYLDKRFAEVANFLRNVEG
jgi:hemoglobin